MYLSKSTYFCDRLLQNEGAKITEVAVVEEVGVTEAEEEAAEGALVEDKEVVEIEARQMEDSNNQDIVSSIFCY